MTTEEHQQIIACLTGYGEALSEKKDWGPIESWRYTQFRLLADELSSVSGITISYLTLTRILQKKDFKRSPQIATLNALAMYLDYEDWEDYCQQQQLVRKNHPQPLQTEVNTTPTSSSPYRILIGALFLISLVAVFYLSLDAQNHSVASDSAEFQLELTNKTPSLPDMIGIKYAVPDDKYSILVFPSSFSLNPPNQFQGVPKGAKSLNPQDTLVLYNVDGTMAPGPYDALLFKESEVIMQLPFNLETEDWVSMLIAKDRNRKEALLDKRGPLRPLFVRPIRGSEGELRVPDKFERDIVDRYMEKRYEVNFFTARDFGLDANNLVFETRLKNIFPDQILGCTYMRITLLTTNGMIEIPLVQTGCRSLLTMWVSEFKGSHHNRSMAQYQKPVLDWESISIETKNNTALIFWDGKLIDKVEYQEPLGELKGIRFKFDGNGAIDYVKLKDQEGQLVYEENFSTEDPEPIGQSTAPIQ